MPKSGKIHRGDCIKLMQKIDDGSVDLVFADPPFNIGYEYDEYDDRQEDEKYLAWCEEWMAEIYRILKPAGTFWLAIGDEYAAELKVAAQRKLGFYTRSWVVWYYTFGVNCTKKFSRSHVHLFHFVKDAKKFTFNADDPEVRVPSARALVYNDKRANPQGRLPDDTWILRPQDFQSDAYGFTAEQDTWFFSRVAGTFKERQGFHGCQMPEQLLGRIIRISSDEEDLVFDPFAGSGTTLAVAKKLGRDFLGTELSPEYQKYATKRLKGIKKGDSLDGPADPIMSAPSTKNGRKLAGVKSKNFFKQDREISKTSTLAPESTKINKSRSADYSQEIQEAFLRTHEGFSSDRLLVDPHLNSAFVEQCRKLGVPGDAAVINRLMLRIRKRGKFKTKFSKRVVQISNAEFDRYSYASEMAWKLTSVEFGEDVSLDEIFCDPQKVKLFDSLASTFAPGFKAVEYRWAAFRLRKRTANNKKQAREKFKGLVVKKFPRSKPFDEIDPNQYSNVSGLYILKDKSRKELYLGESSNIKTRFLDHADSWSEKHAPMPAYISILPSEEKNLTPSKLCSLSQRPRIPFLNINDSI